MTPQSYKGMRDHLPDAMRLRRYITDTLIGVLERYGFEPLSTPIIEYADTLAGKIGDDEKLLFYLDSTKDQEKEKDQEKAKGALRYDQTVPLARVVASNQEKLSLPFKRYALGMSYRGERPQRGRYREFLQLDADIVGVESPIADAEVIAIIIESLQALGFKSVCVMLNHREILSGLARVAGVAPEAAGQVYRAIDKLDKIGRDGVKKLLIESGITVDAAARIEELISLEGSSADVLAAMEQALADDAPSLAAINNLRQIIANLEALGVPAAGYAVSPSLARGLSYYTGVVFEAVLTDGSMGSLLGGGRYDNLVGMFSKKPFPTVGFAYGIERLFDLMTENSMGPRPERLWDAYVTIFDADTQAASLALAKELREQGFSTLTAYQPGKLGKQFKEADQKGATLALVIGPDDLAAGVVQIKDLRTGEQQSVARGDVGSVVAAKLR